MYKEKESGWNAADYMLKDLINRLEAVRFHMVSSKDYESAYLELVEIFKNFKGQLKAHKDFKYLEDKKQDARDKINIYNDYLFSRYRYTRNRGIVLTRSQRNAIESINDFHESITEIMSDLNILLPMKTKDKGLAIFKQ